MAANILQPTSDDLQPTTDDLQPTSDGLQPTSDGLQPTIVMASILVASSPKGQEAWTGLKIDRRRLKPTTHADLRPYRTSQRFRTASPQKPFRNSLVVFLLPVVGKMVDKKLRHPFS